MIWHMFDEDPPTSSGDYLVIRGYEHNSKIFFKVNIEYWFVGEEKHDLGLNALAWANVDEFAEEIARSLIDYRCTKRIFRRYKIER